MFGNKLTSIRYLIVPVTPLQQNASVIVDKTSDRGVIVDPGGDLRKILDVVASHRISIEKIWLTHGHIDHAGGANELRTILEKQTGSKVPIEGPHKADEPILDVLHKLGPAYGIHDSQDVKVDRWLQDGDQVKVGDISFSVLHCPGHSPGSVAFYQEDQAFLIVGDVIFADSVGRTDLPLSNPYDLMNSLKTKIIPLPDDVTFLPGHGPMSTIGAERETNVFLRSAMRMNM